jgi:hypothetical protein
MPRTLNDIIPPSRRRPAEPVAADAYDREAPPPPEHFSIPRRRFPWGGLIVTIIIVAGAIGVLYAFSGAKVEATPTVSSANLSNASFTATPSSGDLPFEIVTVEKVASKSVPAESTATVDQAAQGTVTIYNTQPKAQALVANTRFASPDGHVYRIHKAVSVPAGSESSPGTLTATVYADKTGEGYNIAPTSFTLPGLSGSAQFSQVYAKSTEPFTGGFSGAKPVVGQATDDAEHATLQAALAKDLADAAKAQAPSGYVFIQGGSFASYVPQPDTVSTDGQVVITEKGTMQAIVFPMEALARAIARQASGQSYADEPATLASVESLTLAPATPDQAPTGTASFSFTLSGNASVVWTVDPAKVAAAVAGRTKDEADSAIKTLPEVSRAVLVLRPFWRGTFPSDPSRIEVVVEKP